VNLLDIGAHVKCGNSLQSTFDQCQIPAKKCDPFMAREQETDETTGSVPMFYKYPLTRKYFYVYH